jgi:hypothetical protein
VRIHLQGPHGHQSVCPFCPHPQFFCLSIVKYGRVLVVLIEEIQLVLLAENTAILFLQFQNDSDSDSLGLDFAVDGENRLISQFCF